MNKLEKLGFSEWFSSQVDPHEAEFHEIARVVSVHKGSCVVTKGEGDVMAELSGTLHYTASSALELPTTGDWVYADFYDDDTHAIVHGLLPRRSLIKRKTAGKSIDFQLIAANIDYALIMQSVDENLNLRRLERYMVVVTESDITPVVLLSKCDLVSSEDIEEIKKSILDIFPEATVISFSNVSGDNIEAIKSFLKSEHTYCLLGSSGVGKTTLLNSLLGSEEYETQEVREKDSKGRHTTTSRELIQLDGGALIIDTPGMRELGTMSVDAGLDETFPEILEMAALCKFNDCSHIVEGGCAVLAAIEEGDLPEERYNNYVKMRKEAAYNDMSYLEKRNKDKAFGKMVKSVMQDKRKKRT